MPKLIIDNREIDVPPQTKVIEAAERLGIVIPRFCYHPALGSVGACRVCAVKFLQGPFKGVQMSCMIDAQDGMVVSTTDEEAVDFRKHVIEWLMLSHPHDCPVCDEGGHCLLQDMTVSGGHGLRRFLGKKRTHNDQYLGPLIQHEMNRCIQCYRCSRYYRQFAGYNDLGVMGCASRVYFGRYRSGTLESPFAGNLIDICPTGVYTDKPSRFKGRRWEFDRSPSVCINCSLGCHTVVSARYREIVRQEARYSPNVNGYFICDRGRYGFYYAGLKDRPRTGRIGDRAVSPDEALRKAREELDRISNASGAGAVACVGSTRNSLETMAMLHHLCRLKGFRGPAIWANQSMAHKARTSVSRLDAKLAVSLSELEQADYILVLGADPLNEAPMAALTMRQAHSGGARITVIDPRPVFLPFDFQHLPAAPRDLVSALGLLIKYTVSDDTAATIDRSTAEFVDRIDDLSFQNPQAIKAIARELAASKRPVLVCGTDIVLDHTPDLAADLALLLSAGDRQTGLFYLLPGANAFAAALLCETDKSLEKLLADIENDIIRALILVESNPLKSFPDVRRLTSALQKLDLIVAMDYVDTPALQTAHIVVPTATIFETGGLFINQEGRVQPASRAFTGGQPIAQVSGGDHPPRSFRREIPGGDIPSGGQALAKLIDIPDPGKARVSYTEILTRLAEINPVFADLPAADQWPQDGLRIIPTDDKSRAISFERKSSPEKTTAASDGFEMLLVDWTFGTEELSSVSPCLDQRQSQPCLFMQAEDANSLDLGQDDRVVIRSNGEELEVDLCVVDNMAPGILILPRHHKIAWQKLGAERPRLGKDQILKTTNAGER
jgi:NADH-quinone oxidoreductase subunit G